LKSDKRMERRDGTDIGPSWMRAGEPRPYDNNAWQQWGGGYHEIGELQSGPRRGDACVARFHDRVPIFHIICRGGVSPPVWPDPVNVPGRVDPAPTRTWCEMCRQTRGRSMHRPYTVALGV